MTSEARTDGRRPVAIVTGGSRGIGRAVVEGLLGRFDATAREPGEYAFRLVVLDNAGNFPPPCLVPITIVGAATGE